MMKFLTDLHFEPIVTAGSATIFLTMLGGALTWWIKGMPERKRAENEEKIIDNETVAQRLTEFRLEVHSLRNELAVVRAELHKAQTESSRRGDKINMLRFIVTMLVDEFSVHDPSNRVLAQAKGLLNRIEDEPGRLDNSDALAAAEETVDKAQATVRQVKAKEQQDRDNEQD